MNGHHRSAVRTLALALGADLVLGACFGLAQHTGIWNGIYFATVTATTVGYGDVTPHGWLPHLLAMAIMATVIPLFAATFSLITTGLTAAHIDMRHAEQKDHITRTIGGGQ